MKYGRHAARHDERTLQAKAYLTEDLPAPAPSVDILSRVTERTKLTPKVLFPLDGNDVYGDCTIAALAHAVTVYRGLVGRVRIPSRHGVVALYLKLTGGQDSGMNELDVLNYWRNHQVAGDAILGYAAVDHKDRRHVKQAIQLFGGLYIGFNVQEGAVEDFEAGRPWKAGPPDGGGHAVYVVGYTPQGVTVLTWGGVQRATWGWWDAQVEEAYAILPPEAADPSWGPGLDLAALRRDLAEVSR
jgi:hypothetical protein